MSNVDNLSYLESKVRQSLGRLKEVRNDSLEEVGLLSVKKELKDKLRKIERRTEK